MIVAVPTRQMEAVLPLLSFCAGATDAFAFLALNGIFTANMTGNLVLAAMFGRPAFPQVVTGASIALIAFGAAAALGFRLTRANGSFGTGSRPILLPLALSTACHMAVVMAWGLACHHPWLLFGAIALSAAAMALQTVAARRDRIDHGPTTTYVTGTLIDVLQDTLDGVDRRNGRRLLTLAALPVGVACATALHWNAPVAMPLLPLCASALSLAILLGSTAAEPAPLEPILQGASR